MTSDVDKLRRRFALIAFALLAIFLALAWVGSDSLIGLLRPMAALSAKTIGLADAINVNPAGGWTVWTGLVVAAGPPEAIGHAAAIVIAPDALRDLLRGLPLFVALMLAPPRGATPARRLLIGFLALLAIAVVSALVVVNCHLSVLVDHRPSPVDPKMVPPNFRVLAPAYGDAWFFIASLGFYLVVQVIPLIAPVALWALLKPEAIAMLIKPSLKLTLSDPAPASPP